MMRNKKEKKEENRNGEKWRGEKEMILLVMSRENVSKAVNDLHSRVLFVVFINGFLFTVFFCCFY